MSSPFNFRPDEEPSPRRRRPSGGGAVVALLGLGMVVAVGLGIVVVGMLRSRTPVGPDGGPIVVKSDLGLFLSDWRSNPAGQVAKFKGGVVELSGHVIDVQGLPTGAVLLYIAPDPGGTILGPAVRVVFGPRLQGELKRFPLRSRITVRASFDRVDSEPWGEAVAVVR